MQLEGNTFEIIPIVWFVISLIYMEILSLILDLLDFNLIPLYINLYLKASLRSWSYTV